MYRIFSVFFLLIICCITATAQQFDNQLLLSMQRPTQNNANFTRYNNGPNFNFTLVQAYKPNKAWRMGLGIRSGDLGQTHYDEYSMNDTVFSPVRNTIAFTPFLFIGNETRKYLHKDVFIFTGFDIGLGAGGTRIDQFLYKRSVIDNQYYHAWGERSVVPGRFAMYSFARPQIGARISWGAFIAGYTLGAPIDISTDFRAVDMDLNFRHEFTMGIKFNQRKELKKKFFMIRY